MFYIGIDIGSTTAKTVVFLNTSSEIFYQSIIPTGWSSIETATLIREHLIGAGVDIDDSRIVATGYGRIAVPYANKTVTEITCHAKGAVWLFQENCTVIDIGGQDTKIINIQDGNVINFLMNDKCSAGTGRFLEVMSNILGVSIDDMFHLASQGDGVTISSMCTVFAESEVVNLIGLGRNKADIAFGILDSVSSKVASIANKCKVNQLIFLTGGLCDCAQIRQVLGNKLSAEVHSSSLARWAGAIGAALHAKTIE